MKKTLSALVIVIIIAGGLYYFLKKTSITTVVDNNEPPATTTDSDTATPGGTEPERQARTVIGTSAGGSDILAYHYGTGDTELLFVGGIHGGYEWNTVLVARELMNYLEDNPDAIPANEEVTVIPLLNPDGLQETVGTTGDFTRADVPTGADATVSGRFNGNGVDLNRNFDCDWQPTGVWQNREVDAGTAVFSEPEARAIRDYVNSADPAAVVVWYSAVGGVFASNCHNGVPEETRTLTNLYAEASGYPAYEEFSFYDITGDMVNWLAKENIPAISVLLTNHQDIEWSKNKAGIEALFDHFAQE